MNWTLHRGDCRDLMRGMVADSIDSIVTDPPYGLSFMDKGWDHGVPGVEFWLEAIRVAKPGAHLLAFGGTRTFHRLACAIEDAGWEIRDCVMWVYGSGFPKSHNLRGEWQGWGTALKPAWEPVIVARKPLVGIVAENVQQYGTGAINVDGCRVAADWKSERPESWFNSGKSKSGDPTYGGHLAALTNSTVGDRLSDLGRWPANVIHDGSEEVVGLMGEAARFFYCAKASKADRDEGCQHLDAIARANGNKWTDQDYRVSSGERPPSAESGPRRNHHPTVKPTELMRYLCRLVTPPGGTVLDPFAGSGSTGKAALLEGFNAILCELTDEYWPIIEARCNAVAKADRQQTLFD